MDKTVDYSLLDPQKNIVPQNFLWIKLNYK